MEYGTSNREDDFLRALAKTQNWKASGRDHIHNYRLKLVKLLKVMAAQISRKKEQLLIEVS